MRKATLSKNPIYKNKYEIFVSGLGPQANNVVSLGALENEVGVVERTDKTKTPGGRTSGGSTDMKIEVADTPTFNVYHNWFKECVDRGRSGTTVAANSVSGGKQGISPRYKRTVTVRQHRLFLSQDANEQPLNCKLIGTFPSKYSLDELAMDSEEDQMYNLTLNYDDLFLNE